MPPYYHENVNIYWSAFEPAYRDYDDDDTLDETNGAADVFYYFPIVLVSPPIISYTPRTTQLHAVGYTDEAYHALESGYDPISVTYSGKVRNMQMLYLMCDGCATTGPDGSSAYAHVFNTKTTTYEPIPPSFQLYEEVVNSTGAATQRWLYTGCVVTSWSVSCNAGEDWMATITISVGSRVAATALTNPPSNPQVRAFHWSDTTIVFAYGNTPTAFGGNVRGFTFTYNNGNQLDYSSSPPAQALHGKRTIQATVKLAPTAATDDTAARTYAPYAGAGTDYAYLSVKQARNNATDWFSIVGSYLYFGGGKPEYMWENGGWVMVRRHSLKASEHASSTWVITQTDVYPNTRYEGA